MLSIVGDCGCSRLQYEKEREQSLTMRPTTLLRSLLGVGILSGLIFCRSVEAREIFGAAPDQLEQYFGPYWTRLTEQTNDKDERVTYTYNPTPVRTLFPSARLKNFEVVFINGQAISITSWMTVGLQQFSDRGYPIDFDRLYDYFFGQSPSTQSSVYRKLLYDGSQDHGTLRRMTFCVEDGIAMTYEYASVRDSAIYIRYASEEQCR